MLEEETLLLRQIRKIHIQSGRITSQAFKPMPKDKKQLSVDNGAMVTPREAYQRFIRNGWESIGVAGILVKECHECDLQVFNAPTRNNSAHTLVDFSGRTDSEIARCARILGSHATRRGLCYQERNT